MGHRVAPRGLTLLGTAIFLAVAAAGCNAAAPTSEAGQTAIDTSTPAESPSTAPDTATPIVTTPPTAPITPSPTPLKPTPNASPAFCKTSQLTAYIDLSGGLYWSGAAGSESANFSLKNTSSAACLVRTKAQPQLVNGDGKILITGAKPAASAALSLAPGATLNTMVQTSNLCDAPPIVAPVRVAFSLSGGFARVVASPASPSDTGGIPPCNGSPTVPSGSISMHDWAP